jgi:hypothetical protein
MQESKYIFVFSEENDAENKSVCKCVGKVFLMVKIGSGVYGFTCLLSREVVGALSTKRMTETLT